MADFKNSGKASKNDMVKIAKAAMAVIGSKALSETKMMIETVSVIVKLQYDATYSTLPLSECGDIDQF